MEKKIKALVRAYGSAPILYAVASVLRAMGPEYRPVADAIDAAVDLAPRPT